MPRKPATEVVYELDVTVSHIEPPIWRRLHVPPDIPLPDLHMVLQMCFGWENCHLHQFLKGQVSYGPPDPDGMDQMRNEAGVKLSSLMTAPGETLVYHYDFGDDWRHEVLLHGVLLADPARQYPVCLDGKRSGPPEDCGGPGGYEDLLEALAHPKRREHRELREWAGDFDPEAFSLDKTNAALRAWFAKPAPRKKTQRTTRKPM